MAAFFAAAPLAAKAGGTVAAGSAMSSGALWGGAAAGLGSALGGASNMSGSKARRISRYQIQNQIKYGLRPSSRINFNYYKRQQQFYRKAIQGRSIRDRLKDARLAGVHPLVAMGLTPGGGGGPQPAAPQMGSGQIPDTTSPNVAGSAIERGINTAMAIQQEQNATRHAQALASLQVQEQALRNTWLQEQIKASKVKTASQVANASQDAVSLASLQRFGPLKRGISKIKVKVSPYYDHTDDQHGYNLFGVFPLKQPPGKLTVGGAEEALGEPGSWLYSPFSIVQDIGYTLDWHIRNNPSWKVNSPMGKSHRW